MISNRKTRENKMIKILLLSLLVALTSACSATHVSSLKATVDRTPNIVQVPLKVGVYYSPEFQAYKHVRLRRGERFVVPLGQASVTLFDRVMPIIFTNVVRVPGLPPLPAADQTLAAVIEPRIEKFDVILPWAFGGYTAEITYRFMLYSPDGTPLASWTVNGQGEQDWDWYYDINRESIGHATDLGMQDAAIRFMTGFRDVPQVRQWLQLAGVRNDVYEAKPLVIRYKKEQVTRHTYRSKSPWVAITRLHLGSFRGRENPGKLENGGHGFTIGLGASFKKPKMQHLCFDLELWRTVRRYDTIIPPPPSWDTIEGRMYLTTHALLVGARGFYTLGSRFRIYGNGGIGLYWSKLRVSGTETTWLQFESPEIRHRDDSLGFHAGGGLEADMGKWVLGVDYRRWFVEGDFGKLGADNVDIGGDYIGASLGRSF